MSCPPDVAAILLDILGHGLLACRAAGWSEDAARCAAVADHLHNLPSLLGHYTPEGLLHYWDVMRPDFASDCPADELIGWEAHWARLRPLADAAAELVEAR